MLLSLCETDLEPALAERRIDGELLRELRALGDDDDESDRVREERAEVLMTADTEHEGDADGDAVEERLGKDADADGEPLVVDESDCVDVPRDDIDAVFVDAGERDAAALAETLLESDSVVVDRGDALDDPVTRIVATSSDFEGEFVVECDREALLDAVASATESVGSAVTAGVTDVEPLSRKEVACVKDAECDIVAADEAESVIDAAGDRDAEAERESVEDEAGEEDVDADRESVAVGASEGDVDAERESVAVGASEEDVEADRESVAVGASEEDTEDDGWSVTERAGEAVTKRLVGEKERDTAGETDREPCGEAVLDEAGEFDGEPDTASVIEAAMLLEVEGDHRGDVVGSGDTERVADRALDREDRLVARSVNDKRLLIVGVKLPSDEVDSRAEFEGDGDGLDKTDSRAELEGDKVGFDKADSNAESEGTDEGASVAAADFVCVGGGPQVILETYAALDGTYKSPVCAKTTPAVSWPRSKASVETTPDGVTARSSPSTKLSISRTTPFVSMAMPLMSWKRAFTPTPSALPYSYPATVETTPPGTETARRRKASPT